MQIGMYLLSIKKHRRFEIEVNLLYLFIPLCVNEIKSFLKRKLFVPLLENASASAQLFAIISVVVKISKPSIQAFLSTASVSMSPEKQTWQ